MIFCGTKRPTDTQRRIDYYRRRGAFTSMLNCSEFKRRYIKGIQIIANLRTQDKACV